MSSRAFVCCLIVSIGYPIFAARGRARAGTERVAQAAAATPSSAQRPSLSFVRRSTADTAIAVPVESTLSRTQRLFSRAPVGDALARIAAYGQLEGMPGPEGNAVDDAIALAERQPRAVLDELRAALPGFPAELEANRRQLVHLAARLDAPVEVRQQLILDELGRFGQTESPDVFGPAIMLDLFLEQSDDLRSVEPTIVAVLQQQGAGPVADALLSRVAVRDPEEARALEERAFANQ